LPGELLLPPHIPSIEPAKCPTFFLNFAAKRFLPCRAPAAPEARGRANKERHAGGDPLMPDLLLELRSEEIPALPRARSAGGARTRKPKNGMRAEIH